MRVSVSRLQSEQSGATANAGRAEELQRELAAAQSAATELATRNQALEDTAAERGRSLAEAQTALVSAQRRVNELTDEQTALKAATPAQAAAPAIDSRALSAAQAAAEAARREAAARAVTIEQLTAERANLAHSLEQATSRSDELARRLTATEQALTAAQAAPATAPAPSLQPELDDTRAKLATALNSFSQLERENAALKANAAQAAELATAQTALTEKLAAAEQAARDLESERNTLRQQLANLASQPAPAAPADPAPLADAEAKLATALRSFSLLQSEHDRTKAEAGQLAARKAELEAELAGSRTTANAQVSNLQEQLATTSATAGQVEILRTQLRQIQDQLGALTTENAQLRTRLAITAPAPGTTLGTPTRPGTPAAAAAATPPPAPVAAPAPRTHTVVSGDTLTRIARQYYGDSRRWPEIFEANRTDLPDERSLRVGMQLTIP
ncbi:MAG: LysM peptidoglycan-binding domain-containing protein [Opitutaceae bacterium]|nr:LysM peptidoglycan-binding domain-containing protein [Opitutaceae bacterium]